MLLKKNEDLLLKLKFDEILNFLNTRLFERYKASCTLFHFFGCFNLTLCVFQASSEIDDATTTIYNTDEFVRDAVSLQITPFMLDASRHEYEENLVSSP